MSNATIGLLGTLGAALLLFLSTIIGFLLKSRADARAALDAKNDQAVKREQGAYDQLQEDLTATRTELRSVQADLGMARTEMTRQQEDMQRLWSQMTAVRRELDNAEAHIADVHRWDDTGRNGPMPQRKP